MTTLLRQLRIHQWVKNLLLAVPLLLSHDLQDSTAWIRLFLAISSFSLLASAVYTVNDLADRKNDQQHPYKKNRPIASGLLSVPSAFRLVMVLVLLSLLLAWFVGSVQFVNYLALYAAVTTLYSVWARSIVMLDVVVLSMLYSLRLLAGGAVVAVVLSPWLLAFSLFLFLSLALLKRYTELRDVTETTTEAASSGRGYQASDASLVLVLGPSIGFMAVLVFVLYVHSPNVASLYNHPDRLWALAPVLLYWIGHVWMSAHRGLVHEDPVIYALKDKNSYIVLAVAVMILVVASL
ncbi:MAG: UbiA family prenyltransferase [Chlorobi bacterium]|nr:MAG: UbiA family prenyltransferase [Bacteroidota bacterium]KXK33831.1 MAG: 4-Hydroxybenzoate polyprenyltransferase-like protein [Chlorobi bacterium OLB6]MBE2266044.1 UbiA family prenyltransferase [Flavobacteriales bacterium]MBL1161870.1 UbiA family prenyltransferase [Chlorobiota bacterium]MBW7854356.1 UbiA family prenyltransferase [Candidatus Kapabacteria bacterium]MCC6330687.1 UbiA family prenyltransferase [Ignavibacteria bacterium]